MDHVKPAEYDMVRLRRPLPDHGLAAGAQGTVVMDHTKYAGPDLPPAYEVEFTDGEGRTEAVVTVPEEYLEVIQRPRP
ncbi:DUF4926 domain-containing protein [Mycolicibacterium septicum]|uniref:DUF4926 domain-containing protein n=1 Tax=Mycolicibacterium septicum TaxID=98668 RepID=UPI0023E2F27A|nr:DUF4926 domain-containing protein [Mycolicibacterium septicum]MDF3341794.1 DUF4926 domain-containing protein [Mycolicibacterium septicum]